MSLTLSDMDNFTLAELDDVTLEKLDNMSYTQLFAAVQAKYQVVDERCNKDTPLSDTQTQAITEIVHTYMKEQGRDSLTSLAKVVTIGLATNAIYDFLCFCSNTAMEHLPEITTTLKQIYILLEQMINQAG